jgi:hypothetical protein
MSLFIGSNIFNNYYDYALTKNICILLTQFGFEKTNNKTLFLLKNIIHSLIENISIKCKTFSELSSRLEINMFDILFTLLEFNINQEKIINYINNSKFKDINNFNIKEKEIEKEKKNFLLLKKLNCINVPNSLIINKNIYDVIPKHLRYFPREFTLKNTENIIEKNETFIKKKNEIKKIEKKNLEDIISSNDYYDNSKKNFINIDFFPFFNEITKNINNESKNESKEIMFGKRFREIDETTLNYNKLNNNNNIEEDEKSEKNNEED